MNHLKYWLEQQLAGNKIPLNLPQDQQDLHGLTLGNAIAAHAAWIDKLQLTLRGQNPEEYDPEIVGADHLCAVGKWLYGDGKKLEQFKEYETLKKEHAAFHECAGGILKKHQQKRFADAMFALRNELVELSNNVQIALVALLIVYQENKK
ncbi:MAG: CZB domain-containing protein [Neisseriaceae bacterium]|nr:CZB domain-containing protein [Neisseriaceae bacterium]